MSLVVCSLHVPSAMNEIPRHWCASEKGTDPAAADATFGSAGNGGGGGGSGGSGGGSGGVGGEGGIGGADGGLASAQSWQQVV